MIRSMTGFGRGEATVNNLRVTVEIKTLNSRYLDISPRIPGSIQQKELDLKEIIQKHLSRGKVLLNAYVDKSALGLIDTTFNEDKLRNYGEMLHEMRQIAGIDDPLKMDHLLNFEDVFESRKEDESLIENIWKGTQEATASALEHLNTMRQKEGRELQDDLTKQIQDISNLLEKITEQSSQRAPETRQRLTERIQKMVSDDQFDPDRMEMEIAILVDKMDINEEAVRLQSHLKFFLEALDSGDSVGRRLNFLCQEINRELNTIGSKANDSEIAHHVVIGKEKLEQIREQVQNIE
ncbi:YicC/YloC family endoribonuclease [Rhodohalobacter sp. SW132]|uniref:YicC/YloC family endoribonuclease n=1 Tax=Rhodohalobacter sp. SW132 TaxID=2293433 RepID=UPI001F1ED682|nr:YicC/YloC family endoribonuclease [Rhodohalobacter sp. SW132]